MTCDEARAALLAHVRAAPSSPGVAPPPEVVDHVGSCLECLADLAVTGAAVTGQLSRVLAGLIRDHGCELVERALPELARRTAEGADLEASSPMAWAHLEGCSPCRSALEALCEVLREAEGGAFGAPPDRDLDVHSLNEGQPPRLRLAPDDLSTARLLPAVATANDRSKPATPVLRVGPSLRNAGDGEEAVKALVGVTKGAREKG